MNFSSDDSSNTDFAIARYNPDGTPDGTFGNDGQITTDFDGFNDDVFSILIQPDGKLIADGSAKNPANFYDFALARYLPNGTIDATFGVNGKVRTDFGAHDFDRIRSAALQADGKIVTAGFAIFNNGLSQDFALARYNATGTLNSSFDADGRLMIDFGSCCQGAYSVLLQADGGIVTVGYPNSESSDGDFLLARLNSNGALNSTFGVGGKVRTSLGNLNDGANGALLRPDGKIVAVAFHPTASNRFAEFAAVRYLNGPGFSLSAAVSRKVHGSAGTFDLSLPLTGTPGLKSRSTSGSHTLVFTFSGEVVSGSASVTAGLGSVMGNPVFAGNTMTVSLAGVSDVQTLTVTLSDVTSSATQVLPAIPVNMNLLAGDVTADKTVNRSDLNLTKDQLGLPVTSANFREDVDVSGEISSNDVRLVKTNLGHSLP